MLLGSLCQIHRYPVKSLRGQRLESAEIWEGGVRGDRVRQLVVQDGHARLGKPYRGMEHDGLHLVDDVEEARALAGDRGVTVRVEDGERLYYRGAISLIFDRWLDGLSAHVGYSVEPERFRPNFVAKAEPEFNFDELDLLGATFDVGGVRLLAREPILRCVVTTYHPEGKASDPRILRYVAQERGTRMGLYCDVLRTGTARKGDSLFFVER